jgi:hypothetical protein
MDKLVIWGFVIILALCALKGWIAPNGPDQNCATDDVTHYTACETIVEPDHD